MAYEFNRSDSFEANIKDLIEKSGDASEARFARMALKHIDLLKKEASSDVERRRHREEFDRAIREELDALLDDEDANNA